MLLYIEIFTTMIEVKKTTYDAEGIEEACYEVTDGFTKVRIAKMYHYIGNDTLVVSEYLDGEFNGSEEIIGDFDTLTEDGAKNIARRYSAYLEK